MSKAMCIFTFFQNEKKLAYKKWRAQTINKKNELNGCREPTKLSWKKNRGSQLGLYVDPYK